MNLKYFIQQYDEDYKMKQEKERLKNLRIFRKSKKYVDSIEDNIDFNYKENEIDKDDFNISR